jgi:hypothetical protein
MRGQIAAPVTRCAAGSCSAMCARSAMRSWIDSGDHMSVITLRRLTLMLRATEAYGARLPRCDPLPYALVRDALAARGRPAKRACR